MMKRLLILIGCLLWALPALAQLPGDAIVINKTPVISGTNTNCLNITSGKVGQVACGGGTATNITVATTTITGGTTSGIVWSNAGVLAAGPTTTDTTGNLNLAASSAVILPTTGSASNPSLTSAVDTSTGIYFRASQALDLTTNGVLRIELAQGIFRSASTGVFGWSSGLASSAADTSLSRTAAGTVGIGTGATGSIAGTLSVLNVTLGSTGVLQLGNAYAAGTVVQTGTVTLKDSSGTTVRVLVANP